MGKNKFFMTVVISAAVIVFSDAAIAQDVELRQRVNRLENEIQTLNQAFFRGNLGGQGIQSPQTGNINHISPARNADIEVKLTNLEQQIRDLTGRMEEQGYKTRQLQAQVESLIADSNLRFQDLEQKTNDLSNVEQGQNLKRLEVTHPKPDTLTLNKAGAANETATSEGTEQPIPDDLPQNTLGEIRAGGNEAMVAYEQAFAQLRQAQYDEAQKSFSSFLDNYPEHELASNAQYWLAETHYVRGEYEKSAQGFARGYQKYKNSPKTSDNLLKLALSLSALDKKEEACVTLAQLDEEEVDAPTPIKHRASQEKEKLGCE